MLPVRRVWSGMLTRDTLSPSDLKSIANKSTSGSGRKKLERDTSRGQVAGRRDARRPKVRVWCRAPLPRNRAQRYEQQIYEAACDDGMGELLDPPRHSEPRASLVGRRAGMDRQCKCALPANSDGKGMAGAVLKRSGVECKVRELKWLGTSAANLDHIEAARQAGGGYVMRSPRPGSSGKLEVLGCQDAIKQGVACELSPSAPSAAESNAGSRPTLSWFKEALSRNGVSCESRRARIVGRESVKRRYLVEFECSDRPEGLVAIVPPAGDTVNPFESMNCTAAAERGIRCELSVKP